MSHIHKKTCSRIAHAYSISHRFSFGWNWTVVIRNRLNEKQQKNALDFIQLFNKLISWCCFPLSVFSINVITFLQNEAKFKFNALDIHNSFCCCVCVWCILFILPCVQSASSSLLSYIIFFLCSQFYFRPCTICIHKYLSRICQIDFSIILSTSFFPLPHSVVVIIDCSIRDVFFFFIIIMTTQFIFHWFSLS